MIYHINNWIMILYVLQENKPLFQLTLNALIPIAVSLLCSLTTEVAAFLSPTQSTYFLMDKRKCLTCIYFTPEIRY